MVLLKSSVKLIKIHRACIVRQALFKHSPWTHSPSAEPDLPMAHWVPFHISWSSCPPAFHLIRLSRQWNSTCYCPRVPLVIWIYLISSMHWGSNWLILHYLNLTDSWVWTVSNKNFNSEWSFPGGSEVKTSACSAGDLGSIPGSGRSPGEGNGNPLQYSCLENPMDRGAWWATVHGVAKSRTQLSDFTFTFTFPGPVDKKTNKA